MEYGICDLVFEITNTLDFFVRKRVRIAAEQLAHVPHVPLVPHIHASEYRRREDFRTGAPSCLGGNKALLSGGQAGRYRKPMTAHSKAKDPTPTISYVGEDGTLAEMIYDPATKRTALAIARPDGDISIQSELIIPTGKRLIPYSSENSLIASGCVLLPSAVGDERDKRDIVEAVTAFLHRYVALPLAFEEIAAHYVLLSWVYDAFEVLPYLRLSGDYGTGKSRGLMTIGSLCYKPFFASGASTVSPIFHILDTFQGTLVLDEADFRFSDATSELVKVLNNGNMQGLPVLRTMTNRHKELNPQAFRVFGPKIVGMRHSFSDQALESRFLSHDTGTERLRADIPLHLPRTSHDEARELRNMLLGFRLRERGRITLDAGRALAGVEPRVNQTALPLLSLIDDPAVREGICAHLLREQDRRRQNRADTFEAAMLGALVDAFAVSTAAYVTVGDITERFNRAAGSELGKPMTNRWVGGFLRNRLRLSTMKSRGVFVVPQEEKAKIDTLAVRFGVGDAVLFD